eukprot:5322592-Amphidinium_carterae.1
MHIHWPKALQERARERTHADGWHAAVVAEGLRRRPQRASAWAQPALPGQQGMRGHRITYSRCSPYYLGSLSFMGAILVSRSFLEEQMGMWFQWAVINAAAATPVAPSSKIEDYTFAKHSKSVPGSTRKPMPSAICMCQSTLPPLLRG